LNCVSLDNNAENQIQLGGKQYKNLMPEECMSTTEEGIVKIDAVALFPFLFIV
jgi:hypothetical protein